MSLTQSEPEGYFTREAFRAWCETRPRGRFERVAGRIVAMAPERGAHLRVKAAVFRALERAIAAAGVPCQALPDGGKPFGYFLVPSIARYLSADPKRRMVIHHRRDGDRIDTRIPATGPIAMAPPGITVTVEEFYDTPKAA